MTNVQIWIGPTGTGKSSRIVDDMRRHCETVPIGAPLFWVVPDDVAFTAERMLMAQMSSVLRPEVITFARLADRIRLAAGGVGLQTINQTGKKILFATAYRELQDTLGPLRRAKVTSGFYQMVLDVFDEMSRYEVNLAALQGALEAAAASIAMDDDKPGAHVGYSLIGKLRDLCRLYIRYRTLLEARNFFDPALNLAEASSRLDEVPWLAESHFYIDGFSTGRPMTPQEIRFTVDLAKRGEGCVVTFPLSEDPRQHAHRSTAVNARQWQRPPRLLDVMQELGRPFDSFPGAAYSMLQLVAAYEEREIDFEVTCFQRQHRFHSPVLEIVEKGLREPAPSLAKEDVRGQNATFWRAADEASEAQAVAHQITQWIEAGECQYADIAVVVPSIQICAERLQQVFTKFQIPFALDVFPPLSHHPIGRFILAALRVVRENLSPESMAHLLRTDYVGLSRRDADWFDVYIRTNGIRGSEVWLAETSFSFSARKEEVEVAPATHPADERADGLRRKLVAKLSSFLDAFAAGITTPGGIAQALWELLVAFDVKAQVAAAVVREDAPANPLLASQQEQAWTQVMALLNDLASVYADAPFEARDVVDFVTDALAGARQSTIPGGVNQVFICDYQQAHSWTKRHVFILGLDEHHLPLRPSVRGLLQDDEREMFAALFGTSLGMTLAEKMAVDRQIPYMLFTRASHLLTLSYVGQQGGTDCQPSPYFSRILSLCGGTVTDVSEATVISDVTSADEQTVIRPGHALDMLVKILSDVRSETEAEAVLSIPLIQDIVHHFSLTENRKTQLDKALRGLRHQLPSSRIPEQLARQLYGVPLKTSVNRLELYASCPYAYFVKYGLRAEPIRVRAIRPTDLGNLLHDTVFALMDAQRRGDIDLAEMTREAAMEAARTSYEQQLARPKHAVFRERASQRPFVDDMQAFVERIAEVLWRQCVDGAFRPFALEWSFGLTEHGAGPLVLTLKNGDVVELRGRVDRLDVFEEDGTLWFRIFDYKTRAGQQLVATKMFHGIQLQLMTYAAAAKAYFSETGVAHAGGVFYMPLVTQPGISEGPSAVDAAKRAVMRAFQADGYMNADPVNIRAMDHHLDGGGSDLFANVYKKDGSFTKSAKVWSDDQWSQLMTQTLASISETAEQMTSGLIPVRPYLISHQDRACQHCQFAAVCHFEPVDHAHAYRVLAAKRWEDVLQEEQGGTGGNEA